MINWLPIDQAFHIWEAAGNPDIPDTGPGIYVILDNHRYLLANRNGKHMAIDISVYADDGTLLSDETDVFIHALYEGGVESVKEIASSGKTLFFIGAAVAILYLWKK